MEPGACLAARCAVSGSTSQGQEIRGTPRVWDRHRVVFEVNDPSLVLRTSEVIGNFELLFKHRTLYSGRAVVKNLLNDGVALLCEVALEANWAGAGEAELAGRNGSVRPAFSEFLREWQKLYVILPQFKIAIADLQSFLADLRLWFQDLEMTLQLAPSAPPEETANGVLQGIEEHVSGAIRALFERFEVVMRQVEPPQRPAHLAFAQRQVLPLLMASPFVWRTLRKPLGYAGDYEMVNMMMRSPYEGDSLYAKAVNAYALSLPPILAHRNRLVYLRQKLGEETRRCALLGRRARVFNLGCGPAWEIQLFLREDGLSDHADFTLLDFNSETITYAQRVLEECRSRHGRSTSLRLLKQSVQQILRQSLKARSDGPNDLFDFVYCAGLFDYLPDPICKNLTSLFYRQLAPGGLMLCSNVDDHPSRNEMECFLDWHLIYRNTRQMRELAPPEAPAEQVAVIREATGVNVFLEVRKPLCD